MDEAIKNGYLTKEAKDKLLDTIDVEIENANLEEDTKEKAAKALENFAGEIDEAVDKIEKDLESVDKGLLK